MTKETAVKTNTKVLLREHPFLSRYVSGGLRDVKVTRLDREILDTNPCNKSYRDECFEDNETVSAMFFLDKNGKRVAKLPGIWWLFRSILVNTRTIRDAFERMDAVKLERIVYAIMVGFARGSQVTLYKLPKNYENADKWLKAIHESEQKEIRHI